jgi:hypothetical protein
MITATECKRFTDFIGRKATDTYDLENGRRVKVYTSHYKGSKAIVTVVKECSGELQWQLRNGEVATV